MTKHNNTTTTPDPALRTATPEKALPAANIKFVGRKVLDKTKRKILSDPAPIDRYYVAGKAVKLPPADWQKAKRLFYHESATEIARLFPHLYKLVKRK